MIKGINASRLWARLHAMAGFTRPDAPWTRRAFSDEFIRGRQWLAAEFEAAGLAVRLDAAGNLIGRLEGEHPQAPALVTGSHTDTVLHGGRFDGVLGVVAGLEAIQSLRESGHRLRHPLEVIDFLAEEPTDHGLSCVGSRALAGTLTEALLAQQDPAGEPLSSAIRRMGGQPERLELARRPPGSIAAFVELHIEQGPVLEGERLPLGVVTHIVGIRRVAITVTGRPDHAGTTPMALRQDALAGAARLITAARSLAEAHQQGPAYVVATVGRLEVRPNAANAVPGQVDMTLEVRSDDAQVLHDFPERLLATCEAELYRLRVRTRLKPLGDTTPVACHPRVMQAIEKAAGELNLPSRRLPSGAGHDALHLAGVAPVGMIFVPCLDGRSHCPEEAMTQQDAARGAHVLAATLAELDRIPMQDAHRMS